MKTTRTLPTFQHAATVAAIILLVALPRLAEAQFPFTNLHSFSVFPNGAGPNGLVQDSNGSFYGTTLNGGTNGGHGTVFSLTTNGVLTVLHDFTGGLDGASSAAALALGSDGNFYGTTSTGGTNGNGTVFKISTNGALTSLHSFTGANDGAYPNALVLGSDGSLYGTTQSGGVSSNGTAFRITTSGELTTIYNFGAAADRYASTPATALVQGSDNRLFGTTEFGGGAKDAGTIFAISTNGALTSLYSFSGGNDGAYPAGATLTQDTNGGLFYGTTPQGGAFNFGTVFEFDPSQPGHITTLYTFGTDQDTNGDPLDGSLPNGLVQGVDGNLYGTTQSGGINDDYVGGSYYGYYGVGAGDGTLFSIFPTIPNSFKSLLSFDEHFLDGYFPIGSLIPGPKGVLYGVASAGGANNKGAVFVFTSNGDTTNIVWLSKPYGDYQYNLQNFGYIESYVTGGYNQSPVPSLLTPGTNGKYYGTTTDDGTNGSGTVYVLNIGATNQPPPPPVIQSVTRVGGIIDFSWAVPPGSTYQVQFKTNLLQRSWLDLGTATNAAGATAIATDSISNSQRFYRLELLP